MLFELNEFLLVVYRLLVFVFPTKDTCIYYVCMYYIYVHTHAHTHTRAPIYIYTHTHKEESSVYFFFFSFSDSQIVRTFDVTLRRVALRYV